MTGRRDVIKAGLATLAATRTLSAWSKDEPRPAPPAPLMTKAVPSTGERLAAIGVGTNNYSPSTAEERAARREVLAGLTAAGASIIDTAPVYRLSEQTIGELLADIGNRKQAFIATKVTASDGKLAEGVAMIEESRRRLRTDVLDLVQIHNLTGVDVLFPHLNELKRKGQVRYIGITTSSSSQHDQMVALINSQPLDFVQVDFSLGNRAAAEKVLPAAFAKRVGVLVNMPFGGRRDGNLFSRVAGRDDLPDWAGEIDAKSWGQVFLKYVVSHPAVTAAIPGMTKLTHLEENLAALRGRMPDASMRARIEKYWDQNFDA
ncbi:MAG TPA: aldo/keto reductase [Steroidobacteraceae bacterium]|jgi:aryl-alcohol dehydrogenase-like predicted oxidoreductase|nr:aldo/keto reductase [Steroidobacteraceae bacterium]